MNARAARRFESDAVKTMTPQLGYVHSGGTEHVQNTEHGSLDIFEFLGIMQLQAKILPSNVTMSSGSKAPGPVLQWLNELLHREPFSFLFYGVYWCIVLIILSPVVGVFLLVQTALRLTRYLVGYDALVPQQGMELAVVITGCDSGFGQQLAFALARSGYTVFAGCLQATSQFDGESRIISLVMDVTKDNQVQAAAQNVEKWLTIGDSKTPRYLHAVVNNAGIGHGGLVDWVPLTDFQQDMDGKKR